MKLLLKNLGAAGAGSIDLDKRINLFCGPNSTGKTYVAFAVYALLCRKILLNENEGYVDTLTKDWTVTIDISKQNLHLYRALLLNELKATLTEAYGIGQKDVKSIFSNFDMKYEETDDEFFAETVKRKIDRNVVVQGINVKISKKNDSDKLTLTILDERISEENIPGMKLLMNSAVCHTLVLSPINNLTMLPVERNSIYTFSKELSLTRQMTIDQMQAVVEKGAKNVKLMDIINKNSNRYPLPITHRIKEANDLVQIKKQTSAYSEFATQLEEELLHGKVEISDDGEIRFRPDKINSRTLPIVATASIVKTMSSLVVYLKHQAQKDDLIIIDEPEINLYPANQIALTRVMARLANMGLRLMVSTHSDYIIRELNNLIMMSNKENQTVSRLREDKEYMENEYINPEDIAVNYFDYKTKASKRATITQISVDRRGFDVEGINDIIERQNRISETLYYGLEDE